MNEYIVLMHNDAPVEENINAWESYIAKLKASGQFEGGSSIGQGECFTKSGNPKSITSHLSGYLRIRAENLKQAQRFLEGNPIYDAGGTVEIRELPRD